MTGPPIYSKANPFAPQTPAPVAPADSGYSAANPFAPQPEPTQPDKPQGFLHTEFNVFKNWMKVNAVKEFMGSTPDQDPHFTDPDMIAIHNAVRQSQANGSGLPQALQDMFTSNFYSKMFDNTMAQFKQLAGTPGGAAKAILEHPINTLGQVSLGVMSPINEASELQSGVSLTGDDVHALTPAEKAHRIKDLTALAVATGVGMGVAKAVGLGGEAVEATSEVSSLAPKGKLAKAALHATVGVTSGAAYGLVSHANENDQLASAIISGVQFAAIPIAADILGVGLGKAADVANLRRVQEVGSKTIPQIVKQTEAIASSDNIPQAILKGNLEEDAITLPAVEQAIKQREAELAATPKDHPEYGGIESTLNVLKLQRDQLTGNVAASATGEPVTPAKLKAALDPTAVADQVLSGKLLPTGSHAVLVQGVDLGKVGQLGTDVPAGYRSVVHVNEDGTGDLLVHNLGEGDHEDFFKKTGFVQGQVVSHDGNTNWKVIGETGGSGGWITLENRREATQRVSVPLEQVSHLSDVKFGGTVNNPVLHHFGEYAGGTADWTKSSTRETGSLGKGLYFAATKDKSFLPAYDESPGQWRSFTVDKSAKIFNMDGPVDMRVANDLGLGMGKEFTTAMHEALANGEIKTNYDLMMFQAEDPSEVSDSFMEFVRAKGYHGAKMGGETNIFPGNEHLVKPAASGEIRIAPTSPQTAVNSLYDEWKAGASKPPVSPLDLLEQQRALLNSQRASTSDPATLKSIDNNIARIEAQSNRIQEGLRSDHPIGFDEMPPDDFMDREPTSNPQQSISDFLQAKGFDSQTSAVLKDEFQNRLAREAFTRLEPGEQTLVQNARRMSVEPHDVKTMNELRALARSNAMAVMDAGSRIVIRDRASNKILRGFDTVDEAAKWIKQSGQASGVELAQPLNTISTEAASGGAGMPPEGDPHASPADQPYHYMGKKLGGFAQFVRFLDNFGIITRLPEWAKHMDGKFGTELNARIVDPLMKLRSIRNDFLKPYSKRLEPLIAIRDGLTAARREVVFTHMETRSPEQLATNMSDLEQGLSRQVHASGVDPRTVLQYNRALSRLESEYPVDARNADPKVQAAYNKDVLHLRQQFSIDDNALQISTLFNQIKGKSADEINLGKIVRHAQSLGAGTGGVSLTPEAFATKMKMTPNELRLSSSIGQLYSELGDVFGIGKDFRLDGYITHARAYYDGDIPAASKDFTTGDKAAADFAYRLARTGEISAFDKDPISALLRYMKAGFDEKSGFTQALADAENYKAKALLKIPEGSQQTIKNTVDNFIHDARGFPAISDTFTQDAVDAIVKHTGMNLHVDVKRGLVDAVLSTVNAAAIGLRPAMGVFHLVTSDAISIADRSLEYTARANAMGVYAKTHPEVMAQVRAEGGLATVSSIGTYSAAERALERSSLTRAASKGLATADEAMFRLTGLPDIFETLSAGHYLTTKADALGALTKWRRGEISWNQVRKETFLDRHAVGDAKEFESLVRGGKDEDAAKFLGRQTVEGIVGYFGNASHPSGWGSNIGHIAGQYGNWTRWYASTLTRLASQGTVASRIGAVAKLAGSLYAAKKAGEAVGVDLAKFNFFAPFGWFGGPLVGMAEDATTYIHSSGYVKDQAGRRLMRALPMSKNKWGNWSMHPGIFLPGSYAVDGWMKAAKDFQDGNAAKAGAEALGFRPIPPKR